MTIYLVAYSDYEGLAIDEDVRYFTNEAEAEAYADAQNARYNIKDAYDCFVVVEIAKG